MGHFPRLTFLRSSLQLQHKTSSLFPPGALEPGVGGSCRGCSSKVSKLENNNRWVGASDVVANQDEIAKIRKEFDAARKSFLKIPEALKEMPKMNPEGIYVNKNVRLDNIEVYGFDYDYTLAHYSANLQSLIYDLAKEHMVNEFRYPGLCMEFKYDPTFPIRGLYYDKKNGCLLKLDFFGSIEPDGCYFGRRKLSMTEIDETYGTRHIGRHQACGLVGLMDFFCFSEACLIADMVQHFVDAKLEFDASYIYHDVNHAIQHVHRSGLVHRGILSDPHKYLVKNGNVLRFLRMLKEKGKKLFLMTNSPYHFVNGGMNFMLEDSMGCGESWRDLFDVVIAKANKPDFYTSERPFRYYDTQNDILAFTKVDAFLPDQIYYHGCLKSFLQITKWKGPEVIYFGDHLFSDLRGPSKAGWRTAAIIHELEEMFLNWCFEPCWMVELKVFRKAGPETVKQTSDKVLPNICLSIFFLELLDSMPPQTKKELNEVNLLDSLAVNLRMDYKPLNTLAKLNEISIQNGDSYRFEQAKFHIIQELLGKLHSTVASGWKSEAYQSLFEELNEERQKTRLSMKKMFNRFFGATFLTDTGQESAFAYHIHRYADVYTSKPENFLHYTPDTWLHVPFDIKIIPHHVKVPSSLFKTQ